MSSEHLRRFREFPRAVHLEAQGAQATRAKSDSVFRQVHWSAAYIAFLIYIFVITTYRLPLGTFAMAAALLTLPLERRPLRLPAVALWSVLLLGWAFLGWATTQYPNEVWDKTIEFAKICGVIVVTVNVLTTRSRLQFYLLVLLGFFALYPVRGTLFNYFIYHSAVAGRAAWNYVYENPNDLAGVCLLQLSLVAGVLVTERQRWIRMCAAAGAVVLPLVILLTQSRGAFIGLLAFGTIVLKGQKGRRGSIILVTGVSSILLLMVAPSSLWQRLGTLSDVSNEQSAAQANDEGSARQRLEIWRVARTIVQENPLIGVGLGAYPDAHYAYAQRPIFDPMAMGHRDSHSTYLSMLAETGVIGFSLFLLIIGVTVLDAERTRKRARALDPPRATQLLYMELGLFGFLVAGIWGSYGQLVLTYLHLSVMHATTQILKEEMARTRSAQPTRALSTPPERHRRIFRGMTS
jgi:probable O-glycosylation ligase (exosortase A-associated)